MEIMGVSVQTELQALTIVNAISVVLGPSRAYVKLQGANHYDVDGHKRQHCTSFDTVDIHPFTLDRINLVKQVVCKIYFLEMHLEMHILPPSL